MKKVLPILAVAFIFLLASCHESLADRAVREAKEYTQRYCPTPVNNFTRTDSIVFDKTTNTYIYYCTLTDKMDDAEVINAHKTEIKDALLKSIISSTNITVFKNAGFNFAYICRSQTDPKVVLFDATYTKKDYNR